MKTRLVSLALAFVGAVTVLIVFSTPASAETIYDNAYAINRVGGNFTGIKATFTVPSVEPTLPGPGACINHPLWVIYPNNDWVEIGIAKCYGEQAGKYHVYGGRLAYGQWQWMPASDQLNLGQQVQLEIRKTSSNTWEWFINGVSRWLQSSSAFTGPTNRLETGMEVQSYTFRAETATTGGIHFQVTIGGLYYPVDVWNPDTGDSTPERYYIYITPGIPSTQWTYGYGLPSLTNWNGAQTFGLGHKDVLMSPTGDVREAELYAGYFGIDNIVWKTTSDGLSNIYVVAWNQWDRVEWVMEIPSNPFRFHLIGVSDKPGPVLINVYVDGVYRAQVSLAHDDNARHLVIQDITVPGLKTHHAHAIAVEFANDYYGGGGDLDRNMFVDVTAILAP